MQRICSIDGCDRPAHARTWCGVHYGNWRRRRNPLAVPPRKTGPDAPCSIGGCNKPSVGRGWCAMHWARWKTHGDPVFERTRPSACAVEGCGKAPRSAHARYCETHYYRLRRRGTLETRTAWTCIECGREFTADKGRAPGRRWCSARLSAPTRTARATTSTASEPKAWANGSPCSTSRSAMDGNAISVAASSTLSTARRIG